MSKRTKELEVRIVVLKLHKITDRLRFTAVLCVDFYDEHNCLKSFDPFELLSRTCFARCGIPYCIARACGLPKICTRKFIRRWLETGTMLKGNTPNDRHARETTMAVDHIH